MTWLTTWLWPVHRHTFKARWWSDLFGHTLVYRCRCGEPGYPIPKREAR